MQNFNNQQFNERPIRNSFRPTQPIQPKRNLKLYIWVIVISIIIGIAVFFLTRGADTVASPNAPREVPSDTSTTSESDSDYYPSSTPKATPPPLDENSDLEAETENLDPKDYSGDFENLKKQI